MSENFNDQKGHSTLFSLFACVCVCVNIFI